MNPLLLIGLTALGTGYAVRQFDRNQRQATNVLSRYVTSLTPGSTYQVLLQIDPKNASWQANATAAGVGAGGTEPAGSAHVIGSGLSQLGWDISSAGSPTLLDQQQAVNWQAGQPATWTFAGKWTLPSNAMPTPSWAGWIGMMNAYLLPSL